LELNRSDKRTMSNLESKDHIDHSFFESVMNGVFIHRPNELCVKTNDHKNYSEIQFGDIPIAIIHEHEKLEKDIIRKQRISQTPPSVELSPLSKYSYIDSNQRVMIKPPPGFPSEPKYKRNVALKSENISKRNMHSSYVIIKKTLLQVGELKAFYHRILDIMTQMCEALNIHIVVYKIKSTINSIGYNFVLGPAILDIRSKPMFHYKSLAQRTSIFWEPLRISIASWNDPLHNRERYSLITSETPHSQEIDFSLLERALIILKSDKNQELSYNLQEYSLMYEKIHDLSYSLVKDIIEDSDNIKNDTHNDIKSDTHTVTKSIKCIPERCERTQFAEIIRSGIEKKINSVEKDILRSNNQIDTILSSKKKFSTLGEDTKNFLCSGIIRSECLVPMNVISTIKAFGSNSYEQPSLLEKEINKNENSLRKLRLIQMMRYDGVKELTNHLTFLTH
jgi:hypothetical protein